MVRGDPGTLQDAPGPAQIQSQPTLGAKAFHTTFPPHFRQRGQKRYPVGPALDQHGGYPRNASEIAVDLEGRVIVKQVGQSGALQQQPYVFPRLFPVPQSRPEIDDPRPAPAGVAPSVGEAAFQGLSGRAGQVRGLLRGDLTAWIQGEQMGDVPVTRFHLRVLLQPFLQGAVGGNLRLGQVLEPLFQLCRQPGLPAQHFTGLDAVLEQQGEDLAVHGAALAQTGVLSAGMAVGVLRGQGGKHHPAALFVPSEKIHKEQAGVPQQVEVPVQEGLVQGVLVPLPDVGAHPGGAHHPVGGGDAAVLRGAVPPEVRVVVGHKPSGAVHGLGHLPAPGIHLLQKGEKGHVALGQVAGLHRPVVHFRVDVDGVLAVPGRLQLAVPDTLQVGGQGTWPAGGNGQIPPKPIVQGDKP